MSKINLLIIFGGASPEYYVSCSSAADIILNVDREKYDVYVIGISQEGIWYNVDLDDESIRDGKSWLSLESNKLANLSLNRNKKGFYVLKDEIINEFVPIDVVFPIIHGETGEDGEISGVLEIAKIPYVGSNVSASACCMDKKITRMFVDKLNIPQPNCYILKKEEYDNNNNNNKIITEIESYINSYPMFVKPDNTGSSVGISRVDCLDELNGAIEEAFRFSNEILIEEGIVDKEIKVAIIGNKDNLNFGSICQITCDDGVFNTYETKYTTQCSVKKIPAEISKETEEKLFIYSKEIYNAIECSSFARIDYFLKDSKIYFNEVNNVPGFSENSIFSRMFIDKGISHTQQIDMLIETALNK